MSLLIATIIGARPQFIKAAVISRALREKQGLGEVIIHTGQHYDENMSEVFFTELEIPSPNYHLDIGSLSHGAQTGRMLEKIEEVLLQVKPDIVLVYGDTNSTLAGSLAGGKLHIPVAHIEAGLRSFNRSMPEEINRVMTDHLSSFLFCPSEIAVQNLKAEGIQNGVYLVGDVMADALQHAHKKAYRSSKILERLGLEEKGYYLATVHRAENTDDSDRLDRILKAFEAVNKKVVWPVHPRTGKILERKKYFPGRNLLLIEPQGYLDMIRLESGSGMILTDSGGIQKEAYWLEVPCITLRVETEWVETVQTGWNILTGANTERIVEAVRAWRNPETHPALYGDGQAATRCIQVLQQR